MPTDWVRYWDVRFEPRADLLLPNVALLAQQRGKRVTVFDLETAQGNTNSDEFGITEIALVRIEASGAVSSLARLVDPENPIHWAARKKTGIDEDDVGGEAPWAVWCDFMHVVAATDLTAAFHSRVFDCPAVIRQNARYGRPDTQFVDHLDVRRLLGGRGSLETVARERGIEMVSAHRALVDTIAVAQVLDHAIAELGVGEVIARLDQGVPISAAGLPGPRADRLKEIVGLCAAGSVNIAELATRFNLAPSTIEKDIVELICEGEVPHEVLTTADVQLRLDGVIEQAIAECWIGELDGRHKPLKEWLDARSLEVSYADLKICLWRRGRWAPKPSR